MKKLLDLLLGFIAKIFEIIGHPMRQQFWYTRSDVMGLTKNQAQRMRDYQDKEIDHADKGYKGGWNFGWIITHPIKFLAGFILQNIPVVLALVGIGIAYAAYHLGYIGLDGVMGVAAVEFVLYLILCLINGGGDGNDR